MNRFLVLVAGLVFSGFALAAVNLNTATQQDLEALSGIGPAKARAIIAYRKANGPFKSIDQIKNVTGVGDAIFDSIKGDIAVSGNTTLPPPKPDAMKPSRAAKLEAGKAGGSTDSKAGSKYQPGASSANSSGSAAGAAKKSDAPAASSSASAPGAPSSPAKN